MVQVVGQVFFWAVESLSFRSGGHQINCPKHELGELHGCDIIQDFPGGSDGKTSVYNVGDPGWDLVFIPLEGVALNDHSISYPNLYFRNKISFKKPHTGIVWEWTPIMICAWKMILNIMY